MLKVRNATSQDAYFIRSSFYTSYLKKGLSKHVELSEYKRTMDGYINRFLVTTTSLVAYFEEAPDEVLGYIIHDGPALVWLYVKGYARRQGIATGLAHGRVTHYVHSTDAAGRKFAASVGLKFNPLLLVNT